jgi:hypothetical protein
VILESVVIKSSESITSASVLELQVWGLAINLAKEHVENRLPEVVSTVAGRLLEMERYEAAGELYEDINAMKEVSIHSCLSSHIAMHCCMFRFSEIPLHISMHVSITSSVS